MHRRHPQNSQPMVATQAVVVVVVVNAVGVAWPILTGVEGIDRPK